MYVLQGFRQIFVRQILRGLAFIHSQGVIHLDLKPFNIMFARPEDDYNLRIIDFGLAERLQPGQLRLPARMCGTLEFISPEAGVGFVSQDLCSVVCSGIRSILKSKKIV